ncbi:MAG: LysM peptidoglycan-binding domain-containing protein [Deltaproteobacteria bacterium]|nr:MAG: LysM peptidoglycan-binding domain-containing protein [Deltaproteobacteria bacterium]
MLSHWGLALAWLIAIPAYAAEDNLTNPVAEAAAAGLPADADEGPAPDEEAVEAPEDDGVWQWIDRMGGEVPSSEDLDAIRELAAEIAAEDKFEEGTTASAVPSALYKNPKQAASTDPLKLDLVDPNDFDIPIETNAAVQKWIRYFTGSGRKHFERYLGRAQIYEPMIVAELEAHGLPKDLRYVAMIESGYNAHAYSHAGAAGLWQFIPSTGRLYDLRVDWWVDDRRDPAKATDAAVEYLTDLHKMFGGNWELAWAAYNGGPGRVRSAMKKSGAKDFWGLVKADVLHSETENYVPKIMAAAIISKHPERYGFEPASGTRLAYQVAQVDGSVSLAALAGAAETDEETLRRLNPGLRRFATPPEGYGLRVPVGKKDAFLAKLSEIPRDERVEVVRHTVVRGETLSKIAARYEVPVDVISKANRLKNVDHIYVGLSLVIPVSGGSAGAAVAQAAASESAEEAERPVATYTVKSGDTLSGVAARYGVKVADVQRWNEMTNTTIFVGQKLTLRPKETPRTEVVHTVASGENLSRIAEKYGVSVRELQELNGIDNPSHIRVGQKLKVQAAENAWSTYTVKAGDSLGAIAGRYSCSVSDLVAWNTLSSTVIHPGQVLKVR